MLDQFTRASLSIVLNIAEGAGKLSKLDKRRYYMTARGSATESAALLDVCYRLKLLDEKELNAGKDLVVRIVSMLVKLARSCEDSGDSMRSQSQAHPTATTERALYSSLS